MARVRLSWDAVLANRCESRKANGFLIQVEGFTPTETKAWLTRVTKTLLLFLTAEKAMVKSFQLSSHSIPSLSLLCHCNDNIYRPILLRACTGRMPAPSAYTRPRRTSKKTGVFPLASVAIGRPTRASGSSAGIGECEMGQGIWSVVAIGAGLEGGGTSSSGACHNRMHEAWSTCMDHCGFSSAIAMAQGQVDLLWLLGTNVVTKCSLYAKENSSF